MIYYIVYAILPVVFLYWIFKVAFTIFKNAKIAYKNQLYINEVNTELRDNIDDYLIDEIVIDKDKTECKITNKDFSSIEVFIKKKKVEGINHKQWFYIKDFNKRFKKKII